MDSSLPALKKFLSGPLPVGVSVADVEAVKRLIVSLESQPTARAASGSASRRNASKTRSTGVDPTTTAPSSARRGRFADKRVDELLLKHNQRAKSREPAPRIDSAPTTASAHDHSAYIPRLIGKDVDNYEKYAHTAAVPAPTSHSHLYGRGFVASYPFIDSSRDSMADILYPKQHQQHSDYHRGYYEDAKPVDTVATRERSRSRAASNDRLVPLPTATTQQHQTHHHHHPHQYTAARVEPKKLSTPERAANLYAEWRALRGNSKQPAPRLPADKPTQQQPTTHQTTHKTTKQHARGRAERPNAQGDAAEDVDAPRWEQTLRSSPKVREPSRSRLHVPEYAKRVSEEWAAVGSVFAKPIMARGRKQEVVYANAAKEDVAATDTKPVMAPRARPASRGDRDRSVGARQTAESAQDDRQVQHLVSTRGPSARAYYLPGAAPPAEPKRSLSSGALPRRPDIVVPKGGGVPKYLKNVKSRIAEAVQHDRFMRGGHPGSVPEFIIMDSFQQQPAADSQEEIDLHGHMAHYDGPADDGENYADLASYPPHADHEHADEDRRLADRSSPTEAYTVAPSLAEHSTQTDDLAPTSVPHEPLVVKPQAQAQHGAVASKAHVSEVEAAVQSRVPSSAQEASLSRTDEYTQTVAGLNDAQKPDNDLPPKPNDTRNMRAAISWAVPTAELNKKVDVYGFTAIPQHRPHGYKPQPRPKEGPRDVHELIPQDLPMLDVTINVNGFRRFIPRADPLPLSAPHEPPSPRTAAQGVPRKREPSRLQFTERTVGDGNDASAPPPALSKTGPPDAPTIEQKARVVLDAFAEAAAGHESNAFTETGRGGQDTMQRTMAVDRSGEPQAATVETLEEVSTLVPAQPLPTLPLALAKERRKSARAKPASPPAVHAAQPMFQAEPITQLVEADTQPNDDDEMLSVHSLPDEIDYARSLVFNGAGDDFVSLQSHI